MFPESPLSVLFHLLHGLLENISKALGRPRLSFCCGPVLALWNFALTLAFPGSSCPLFTDLPQKDSQERLFWEHRGRPSRAGAQGTAVDFHKSGRSRGAVPSLIHSALCSPGGFKRTAWATAGGPVGGEVLTTWPGMDVLVTSCHLDAFVLEPRVGTFQGPPPPRYTHYSGTLYGFYGGSSGSLFPTTSTVFHRELFFSFRSQLKTFM